MFAVIIGYWVEFTIVFTGKTFVVLKLNQTTETVLPLSKEEDIQLSHDYTFVRVANVVTVHNDLLTQ